MLRWWIQSHKVALYITSQILKRPVLIDSAQAYGLAGENMSILSSLQTASDAHDIKSFKVMQN